MTTTLDCTNIQGKGEWHRIALPDGRTKPPEGKFDIRVVCVACQGHFILRRDPEIKKRLQRINFKGDEHVLEPIAVIFADILTAPVDAIVNPANKDLFHNGGLAAVIAQAAGPELSLACDVLTDDGPIPTGTAVVTTAGKLPFKGVIHVVGPYWGDEDDIPHHLNTSDESPDTLLANAHKAAIAAAQDNGWGSLAFPAVSCGIFRFPVERAAPIALAAVREALETAPGVKRVEFYLLDDAHYLHFDRAREKVVA